VPYKFRLESTHIFRDLNPRRRKILSAYKEGEPSKSILSSVPDPKLIISDPDPQIENQEFRIRIQIRIRILDLDPSVS